RVFLDVTEHRDLTLEFWRQIPIGPAEKDMRLNSNLPELIDRVLRRFGFQLTGCADVRHQRKVDIQDVLAAYVVRHLANRLEEGQALDVADRAADLHDRHVHPLGD